MAAVGTTQIAEVTTADVAEYLAVLREGDEHHPPLAASSAGRAVVAVRGLHAFALAEGLAGSRPGADGAAARRRRAGCRGRSRCPTVERLLQIARRRAGSAPRPGAARAALRHRRADLRGRRPRRRRPGPDRAARSDGALATVRLAGKGGRQRIVPVGSYARAALEAYLVRARPALAASARSGQRSPAVFLNARGGRLTRQGAWGALRAAAARAGLAEISPHTLRHSFATHLLDGGADVRVVQELLGHASVSTTQVYTLVTVDKLREVYAASHPARTRLKPGRYR